MDVNKMTLVEAEAIVTQADQVREAFGWLSAPIAAAGPDPYPRGPVLIRTVTHYLTGRVVDVTSQEIVLEDAAWIASTGRFEQALRTGELDEVEPFPSGRVIVGRGAIIDCAAWSHDLPLAVK